MVRLRPYIAAVVLIFICLFKAPSSNALVTYWFAAKIGIFVALSFWVASRYLWAGLFMLTSVVSVLFFGGKFQIINQLILYAVWFLIVVFYSDREKLIDALAMVLIFHVVLMAVQMFLGDPWALDVHTGQPLRQPTGLVSDKDAATALIAILSPSMFRFKGCWRFLWVVPAAGLIIGNECTGIFALWPAIIFYLYITGNKNASRAAIFWGALGIALFVALVDKPGISIRWEIYTKTLPIIFHNPMGVGLGNYVLKMSILVEHYAHNELLHYTAEMGWIIPILFAGWLFSLRSGDSVSRTALVAATLCSLVYFPLHNPITALVIVTWAAIWKKI